jgi:hypothetical protein
MRGYLKTHGVVADKALPIPEIVSERGRSDSAHGYVKWGKGGGQRTLLAAY